VAPVLGEKEKVTEEEVMETKFKFETGATWVVIWRLSVAW